ncbi:MAG: sugar transferase [Clostridia bacterium]|nr:sugar transferase [Clostridia bacterium]MBR5773097.1 sugar transferase [Clostridia bacterium]
MKRAFDFTCSLIAVIILLPLFALLSLIILIDDGKPVLFRQQRVGRNNEVFSIYKFRTMKNNTGNVATAQLKNSDEFITRSGRFFRKTSLDELPQLFNILKGDMSFVGPRPLIPEEEEIRQLRNEKGVYAVRPGMTGLAQINGRDNLDMVQKTEYDLQYIKNMSFFNDIKILFKTVFVVLSGKDIVEGAGQEKR